MAGMPSPRRPTPVTVAIAAVLGAAACGATDSQESGRHPDVYPVTIGRSGGVAGFSDTMVVEASGAVRATKRSGSITCRIDDTLVDELREATGSVSGSASATPEHPDDLVVVVITAQGSARATDEQLRGPMAPVANLLADLDKAASERRLCR
jgi:hypothetical protein